MPSFTQSLTMCVFYCLHQTLPKSTNSIHTRKKIVKCLFSKSRRSSWNILVKETGITTFPQMIKNGVLKFGHKLFHQNLNPRLTNHFSMSLHSNNLLLSHHKKPHISLHNKICEQWNNLPKPMKSISEFKKFSRLLCSFY